jgi:hypothetical protein
MTCVVKLVWSDESNSWRTESDDIPGLTLGADSFDALVEKVRMAAVELLELNTGYIGDLSILFEAEREEMVSGYGRLHATA